MIVTRISKFSGIQRSLDLDITKEQMINYEKGMLIQHAFPNLTPEEREFFMTGATKEEWDELFGGMDENV